MTKPIPQPFPGCEACENAENDPMGLYFCGEHGVNVPPGNRNAERTPDSSCPHYFLDYRHSFRNEADGCLIVRVRCNRCGKEGSHEVYQEHVKWDKIPRLSQFACSECGRDHSGVTCEMLDQAGVPRDMEKAARAKERNLGIIAAQQTTMTATDFESWMTTGKGGPDSTKGDG